MLSHVALQCLERYHCNTFLAHGCGGLAFTMLEAGVAGVGDSDIPGGSAG